MLLPQKEVTKLLNRSPDTLRRWRGGCYYRTENGKSYRVYYFPDHRKLQALRKNGMWFYNYEEVVEWDKQLSARGPRLRQTWE